MCLCLKDSRLVTKVSGRGICCYETMLRKTKLNYLTRSTASKNIKLLFCTLTNSWVVKLLSMIKTCVRTYFREANYQFSIVFLKSSLLALERWLIGDKRVMPSQRTSVQFPALHIGEQMAACNCNSKGSNTLF